MSGSRPRTRWKAAFFGVAAVAIVAGVAWALLGSRFLVVRSVEVTGAGPMVSRAEVLAAAHIKLGLPLIRVNTSAVAHRVGGIRQVQSAQVSRNWPDTVVISVRLRIPLFAVAVPGGYALVDAFGVDVRDSARRPAGLPLLSLTAGPGVTSAGDGAGGVWADGPGGVPSLRDSPLARAAAAVLRDLPPRIARQVRTVSVAASSDVSLRLAGGAVIVWGDTSRTAEKAKELSLLMRTHAHLYDVSAPGTAVTEG
ncbi:MAG TPA: FtsQ-type POTRA domain-containing protein [Streptosporangiaceae bacterium]|nr:FtsQ-type POTRA domain-containing protein [Streptosporangiaceae bacterium]